MKSTSRIALGGIIVAVCCAALLITAAEAIPSVASLQCPREFQRLVHGLGLGAELDLSQCDASYDWRLAAVCSIETGAVPGSGFRCGAQTTVWPHHPAGIHLDFGEDRAADAEIP